MNTQDLSFMTSARRILSTLRRRLAGSTLAGPLLTLLAIFALFALTVPNFLTWRTLTNIVNATTLVGTVTIGVTLLMIGGEFDLSVGALVAAGGYLFASSTQAGAPLLGVVLAVGVPALLGGVNGGLLLITGMPSFIITLGTLSIYQGAVWVLSGGALLQVLDRPPVFDLFNGRLEVLNALAPGANFRTSTLWIVALALAVHLLLTRTRYGNHVYAVGGDPAAARAQGVHVRRVKLINYLISGALAGFAGVLLFSQFRSVNVATGAGVELDAIAAAVVGGTLLTGGSGSVFGGVIGVLLISTLRSGVVRLDIPFIPADNFEAVVGLTIIGAAVLNHHLRRNLTP